MSHPKLTQKWHKYIYKCTEGTCSNVSPLKMHLIKTLICTSGLCKAGEGGMQKAKQKENVLVKGRCDFFLSTGKNIRSSIPEGCAVGPPPPPPPLTGCTLYLSGNIYIYMFVSYGML